MKGHPRSAGDTVHLILKFQYWDQIADGTKRQEYRDNTPYWRKRILGRKFVVLHRGYTAHAIMFHIAKTDVDDETITITLGDPVR